MIITAHDHPPCPCRVYDANGLEWEYLTQVDTETGEVVQLVRNEHGDYIIEGDDVVRKTFRIPTPILIVPIKQGEPNAV